MKLLAWMQQKLGGRNGNSKPIPNASSLLHLEPEAPKEEIRDWPHGLLTIGTLGSNNTVMKHCDVHDTDFSRDTDTLDFHDHHDHNKDTRDLDGDRIDSKSLSLPAKFKGKDIFPDQHPSNINIHKKSLSFLLKKAFVCNGGFSSPSSPRALTDQMPPDSTMEKILRAILNKKIYPQNPQHPAALSKKKCLEDRRNKSLHSPAMRNEPGSDDDDHDHDYATEHKQQLTGDEGSKWDKTDSEYIVLEI